VADANELGLALADEVALCVLVRDLERSLWDRARAVLVAQ
jgi:hypothetical protein